MVSNRPFWVGLALIVVFATFIGWMFGREMLLGFFYGVTAVRLADLASERFS